MEFQPVRTSPQSEPSAIHPVKSVEYFVALRKELMRDPGGDESIYKVSRKLESMKLKLQSFRTVQNELMIRAQRPRVLRTLQDLMRKKEHPKWNFYTEKEQTQDHKTSELEEIKAKLFEGLKAFVPLVSDVQDIHVMEVDKEGNELIQKYGKRELYELFDPALDVTWDDMVLIIWAAEYGIRYRERKLGEFLSYKYARSVPPSIGAETFLLNTHQILSPTYENGEYRSGYLKSNGGFFAPAPPQLVPKLMSLFTEDVEKTSKEPVSDLPKEALKKYLLFEIIHPFIDGNGRVGRALFVYLQRRFSEDKKFHSAPLNMPVSRPEISQRLEEKGVKNEYNIPGSLSGRVNTIVSAIVRRPAVIRPGLELSDGKLSPEDFYHAICDSLDTEEVDVLLDQALLVMREEGSFDTKESVDWAIISDKIKGGMKKVHTTNRLVTKL